MKKLIGFLLFAFVPTSIVLAQGQSPRDALIEQVKLAHLQQAIFSQHSPIFDFLLQEARNKNRQASEEAWLVVKRQFSEALTNIVMQRGGGVDRVLTQSLSSLSDAELQRLVEALTDPAYIKFQQAIYSPESQKQLMLSMPAYAQAFQQSLSGILRKNGLNW